MGCDIHAYLEFYNNQVVAKNKDEDSFFANYWVDVFSTDIAFHRNYQLFNIMSNGVRGIGGGFDAKGLPTTPKLSWNVASKYYLRVIDDIQYEHSHTSNFYNSQKIIIKSEADKHIEKGIITTTYKGETYIANPDWHSTNYLDLKEMIEVRRKYLIETIKYGDIAGSYTGKKRKEAIKKLEESDEYDLMKNSFVEIECASLNATIAAMIAIEKSGDYKTRLIFWFDS